MIRTKRCQNCGREHEGKQGYIEFGNQREWTIHFVRSNRLCYLCALVAGIEEYCGWALPRVPDDSE